jgi:chromosome segregation protein
MYLERLMIQGFKSFAERLEFVFQPGITAIVGPNGSGKSNVVDAIRWALGEQSLHTLRGERLEDIIFSGSDHRRPHGLAEVTLVFNNSDGALPVPYTEVSVTRRAFRSGNSEFLLNGVACRLRDIQELFWNTGLGREGYSFISQGKVDDVLNLRPEERRVFLEQAAGVWKYRQRKKEAAAKLAQIEQDMLRLGDLAAELERQRGPLEEEAERARVYQHQVRRLKDLEIFLGLKEIEKTGRQLASCQEKLAEEKVELTAAITERRQSEAQDEADKLALLGAEGECESLRQAVARAQEELSDLKGSMADLTAAEREGKVRLETLTARIRDLEARCAEVSAQQEHDEVERSAVTQDLARLRAEHEAVLLEQGRLDAAREAVSCELASRREETIRLVSERAARANEIQALQREEQSLAARLSRALTTGKENEGRAAVLRPQEESLRRELAVHQEQLSELLEESKSLEELIAQGRAEREQKRSELEENWRQLELAKARLSSEEGMLARYEGYGQGVKAVLKAGHKGISGTVAGLLEVPSGLEVALEAALGGAQQYLVAENDAAAASAIAWLKEKGLGRATFLPLNTVRPSVPSARELEAAKHPEVLGWAAELVHYDARHKAAVQHLLGRVLVLRSLNGARTVARKAGYRFKLVTLEGEVINPGGSMTGGSRKEEQPSLLLRARRARDLKISVHKGEAELAELKRQLVACEDELRQREEKLFRIREQAAKHERLITERKQQLAQLQVQLKEIERSGLTWREEAAGLQESMADLNKTRASLEAEWQELDQKVRVWEEETLAYERQEAELTAARSRLEEKLTGIRLKLVSLEEREKQLLLRKREGEELLARLRDELSEQTGQKEEFEKDAQAAARERALLEKKGEELLAELASKQAALQEAQDRWQELKAILAEREALARTLKSREESLRDQVHEREIVLERLAAEYQAAKRRLFEAHGVPVGTVPPTVNCTVAEAEREVQTLAARVAEMGDVNLKAPESLRELLQRQEFLLQQGADLEAAKSSLVKMMREIDRTVGRKLEDTYVLLRANFQQVFKRLFGGGQADLVLTGSDDILSAGIEIMAQLPGKKMQSLSLLSGGRGH